MFLSTPISDSIKNIYEIEHKDSTIFEQAYHHNSKRIESMRLIPALVRRLINSSYLSDLINYRLIAESQWSFIMRLHVYGIQPTRFRRSIIQPVATSVAQDSGWSHRSTWSNCRPRFYSTRFKTLYTSTAISSKMNQKRRTGERKKEGKKIE